MASRLGQHLLRAKSKAENFLICCLTAPWPTFGYYRGNSLTHPMLINAFGLSIFGPKVTGKSWISTLNWLPSGLWSQCLTHLATCRKYSP